jgi:hypothetical protein
MTATSALIQTLASDLRPVRRLRPPLIRACCWLLLAALVIALLAVNQSIRSGMPLQWHDRLSLVELGAMFLTGMTAAIAAFMLSLPDRSRMWLLLPLPALALWLSSCGYQCLTDWIVVQPGGMQMGETMRCFATLVLTSLPLSLAMLVMLRYAAPLRPAAATLTGGLAVAAMAAAAHSLVHGMDATAMTLIWNLGPAVVLVLVGSAFGPRLLAWAASPLGRN